MLKHIIFFNISGNELQFIFYLAGILCFKLFMKKLQRCVEETNYT